MAYMLKNPFGIKDGAIVTAEDVPNGLACGCTCPGCGDRLIANHGTGMKQPYFSHESGTDCEAAYETALHLMAKEVLLSEKRLLLPPLRVVVDRVLVREAEGHLEVLKRRLVNVPPSLANLPNWESEIIPDVRFQRFDRVDIEVFLGEIVPDVVMYAGSRRLLVEIYVTHSISEAKLRWLIENDVPMIEFDFSATNRNITRDELKNALTNSLQVFGQGRPRWVHHPLAKAKQDSLNEKFRDDYLDPINELVHASDPASQAVCLHSPICRVGQDGVARLLCEKCWKLIGRLPPDNEGSGSKTDSPPLFPELD